VAGWKAKRFWKTASAAEAPGGFAVTLDGRPVRTPAKAPLVVPGRALAEAIAQEWEAQGDTVVPATMPLTRAANSAIDKVAPQFAEVAALVAAYGESDLICYRATHPEGLVARQAEAWDPLLDWAARHLDAPLVAVAGVLPEAQPAASVAALAAQVHALSPFALAALHDLVGLSGSLVIGLAAAAGWEPPEALWERSRVDEDWQAAEWGADAEAAAASAARRSAFLDAARFHQLLAGA